MCTWEEVMIKVDNVDKKILQVLFWDTRIKIKELVGLIIVDFKASLNDQNNEDYADICYFCIILFSFN